MKRVLIVGSNGLLGQKVTDLFSRSKNYEILNTSVEDKPFVKMNEFLYRHLDITNRNSVMKLVDDFLPEVIINTAAITNVDLCETERAIAWKVNVAGVENLVHAARMVGAKVIHFSTDYVFDGRSGPYNE
jgi:dTDP-4-dehydrorhamnose reductase